MKDKKQWFSQKTNLARMGLLTFCTKNFPSKVKGVNRIEMLIVKNVRAEHQQLS